LTEVTISAADRRLILTALAVVLLLSALDQSIVSTAMPRIIEQLHGLEMYAWVTTAYLLTSTVSVPIYGKLSDLYGRKPILVIGVLLFLAGSALCGLSGELGHLPMLGNGMMQLIIFRGLQGLGSGALMTVTIAIIADLYPPRERGRLLGVFGSVFGLATVIGPFIGGFFTDHGTVTLLGHEIAGWRWVFYVNLPLGLVALFMILYRLPPLRHRGEGTVDYVGGALLVTTFAPLLLGLTLGGAVYPWASPPIAWLFGVAAASLCIFLWVESRARDAILPLHLFRIKAFSISTLASFVISMSFLGVVMFMPLYMQVVQGVSATSSGVALLPLMAGLIVSSIVCGRLVSRTGRYKIFMIGGGVLLVIGVLSLTFIGPNTTPHDLAWRLALTGIGLGPAQSLFSVVITNSVPITELGVATSVSQFSRQIGSTVGVAIFGAFLTHSLTVELPKHLPLLPGASEHKIDLNSAQSQAMNVSHIRGNVEAAMQVRYQLIERAYQGDSAAVAQVLADDQIPDSMKSPLHDGSVRSREAVDQSLALVRAAIGVDSGQLVQRIQHGTKEAFSTSITQMLGNALWIVIVGVLIVLFIPELPLRSGSGAPTRVEV
jgi:EmrB/QacA subfamily drug resistance transporter